MMYNMSIDISGLRSRLATTDQRAAARLFQNSQKATVLDHAITISRNKKETATPFDVAAAVAAKDVSGLETHLKSLTPTSTRTAKTAKNLARLIKAKSKGLSTFAVNDISGMRAHLKTLEMGLCCDIPPPLNTPPTPPEPATTQQIVLTQADFTCGMYTFECSNTRYVINGPITVTDPAFYFFLDTATGVVFDGQNNTIDISGISGFQGLFGCYSDTSLYVKNLTITATNSCLGEGQGWFFGPYITYPVIVNCVNYGPITGNYCGGFFGEYAAWTFAINCTNRAEVCGPYSGGIYATNAGAEVFAVAISCTNKGAILGEGAGGIFGDSAGENYGAAFAINCVNRGNINESACNAGGIIGSGAGLNNGRVLADSCENHGDLYGLSSGGIFGAGGGYECGQACALTCSSTGAVAVQGGGIFGAGAGLFDGTATATNCYSTGAIVPLAGGIFGAGANYWGNQAIATGCWSRGDIDSAAGGIFGAMACFTLAVNCHSHGRISTLVCEPQAGGGGIFGAGANNVEAVGCHSKGDIADGAGGIFGSFGCELTADSCYSTGKIGLTDIVTLDQLFDYGSIDILTSGGISASCNTSLYFTNCYSTGKIGAASGGICGGFTECGTITNCRSTGDINAAGGGIVGGLTVTMAVANCYSTGSIGAIAGGIYGLGSFPVNSPNNNTAVYSYSRGSIGAHAGGIFGAGTECVTANNCYSTGKINYTAGGLFGYASDNITAQNCYVAGAEHAINAFFSPGDTNVTVTNSRYTRVWVDRVANLALTNYPGTQPQIWSSLRAGTPYVLTTFPPIVVLKERHRHRGFPNFRMH